MAYDMRNPGNPAMMNPGHDMSHEEMKKALHDELDHICSYLSAGACWHLRAANACRKMLIRGMGRWHDCEAKGDFCSLEKLLKIIQDKLGYNPKIDMEMAAKAEMYTMNNMEDFKNHFRLWDSNESELIECLNHAIHLSRTIDIQIYKELMCQTKEVQDERMRARMAKDSFAFVSWNPHDISVKSMMIHKYFEHEHKDGSEININLG